MLETIVPKLLKYFKDSYESKNSLSINERRLLCRSVVDYFESRKIKFSSYRMNDLAGQIVEHFPTEDKVFSNKNLILTNIRVLKIYSRIHVEILV